MKGKNIIPNGRVPFSDIGDEKVRDRIMKLGENDQALCAKISSLEKKIEDIIKKVR